MEIRGSGFSSIKQENIVRISGLDAEVMDATPTNLRVMVPFGVEAGTVRVITPTGEGVSQEILPVVTSISGVVENTLLQPLAGVTVSIAGLMSDKTDSEGHFVLPNIPNEGLYEVEFNGEALDVDPPYPIFGKKISAQKNRDNVFTSRITLQQATGSSAFVGSSPSSYTSDGNSRFSGTSSAIVGPDPVNIETDKFVLEVQGGTRATILKDTPEGKKEVEVKVELFLTPLLNSRTPVELPLGQFSSSIVQITPFGVKLEPGAKLTFPNKDNLEAGAPAILYRYDRAEGKFVQDTAKATVSADGSKIETELGAIKVTSYYFAARASELTTIRGYVYENDGKTPVNRASVRFRGQESYTDGAGSYVLRYVPVKTGEGVSVEVSAVRPNGRVDRVVSEEVPARIGDITEAPDVIMPKIDANRPPTIIAAKKLTVKENTSQDFKIVVNDPDPNQELRVDLTSAPLALFARVFRGGVIGNTGSSASSTYSLRLAPGFNDARPDPYILKLVATDGAEGGRTEYEISVTVVNVNRDPIANSQSITIDEDTSATIKLTASDPDQETLAFAVVDQPLNGAVSGSAPDLTYTPNLNFAGTDRFTFKVRDGEKDSLIATVNISVRSINDPPTLLASARKR